MIWTRCTRRLSLAVSSISWNSAALKVKFYRFVTIQINDLSLERSLKNDFGHCFLSCKFSSENVGTQDIIWIKISQKMLLKMERFILIALEMIIYMTLSIMIIPSVSDQSHGLSRRCRLYVARDIFLSVWRKVAVTTAREAEKPISVVFQDVSRSRNVARVFFPPGSLHRNKKGRIIGYAKPW